MAPVVLLSRRTRCIVIIDVSHNRYRNGFVFTTVGRCPLSFVKWIFSTGQPNHDGDRKTSGVMTLIFPLAQLQHIINKSPDRKHRPWSSASTEKLYSVYITMKVPQFKNMVFLSVENLQDILFSTVICKDCLNQQILNYVNFCPLLILLVKWKYYSYS